MPRIRTSRTRPPPEGFEEIEPQLHEFEARMREIESQTNDTCKKTEACWPVFRLHHQRSRYVYELYYKRHAISLELYNYLVAENYGDAALIAKWKKHGFENLCCLRCIQTRDTNFGTVCVCRVPRKQMDVAASITCLHCGCRGCSG